MGPNLKSRSMGSKVFMLDTQELCLFCLKESNAEFDTEGRLICRILTRYFGVKLNVPDYGLESGYQKKESEYIDDEENGRSKGSPASCYFSLCETCSALAGSMGQMYEQLEVMAMKLNHYGQVLCNIMTSAEKVSSRLVTFNQKFSVDDETKALKQTVRKIRREVLQKCSESTTTQRSCSKNTIPLPKVILEKDPNLEEMARNLAAPNTLPLPVDKGCSFQQPTDIYESEEKYLAYLGCTISLWLVMLLSSMDVDQLPETFKTSKPLSQLHFAQKLTKKTKHLQQQQIDQREQISLKISIPLRKRKTTVECNNNDLPQVKHQETKRSLLCSTSQENSRLTKSDTLNVRDVAEEVTEHGIIRDREEFQNAYDCILTKKTGNKRHRHRKSGTQKQQEQPLCTVITDKKAESAVTAIQTLRLLSEEKKTQVKGDSEMTGFVSNTKESQVCVPSTSTSLTFQTATPRTIVALPLAASDYVPSSSKRSILPAESSLVVSSSLEVPVASTSSLYKCLTCQGHFQSRAKLQKHRFLFHKMANFVECPTCLHMFSSYFYLQHHRKNEPTCRIDNNAIAAEMADMCRPLFPSEMHIKGSNFCLVENCTEVFEDITKLIIHSRTHGSFSCGLGCNKSFQKAHELAAHEIHVHKRKGNHQASCVKCPRCAKMLKTENEYLVHFIFDHLNVSRYLSECSACRKGFYTLTGGQAHFHMYHNVAGKTEENIFRCKVCNVAFLRQNQLLEHRRNIHRCE